MALFDTSRTPVAGLAFGGFFGRFYANTFAALAEWNDKRLTHNALVKLTDRELEDIGLTRGDLYNM